MEDINVLINLNKLYKILTDINEKRTIKRLIDKRPLPFLIDSKLNLTEKELGYGRNYINKVFNQKIEEMIVNFDKKEFYEQEEFYISYYKKKHWLNFNNEYKELTLIRSQFFKQDETKLKKQGLELLNIYTEQQIELIIKKHFKL